MPRFVDEYIPNQIRSWPCTASPRFSTHINVTDSGAEQANRRWLHPLYTYSLPEAVREHKDFEIVRDHWLTMGGPAQTWPWRDPLDFASVPLDAPNHVPALTMADQLLGAGDGARTQFQLVKTYQSGAASYVRPILLPVTASVLVSVNGQLPADLVVPNVPLTWTVSRPGGVVTFSGPPRPGIVVRAGFLFDVEVRFEADDSFDGIAKDYGVSGIANLKFLGVRSC